MTHHQHGDHSHKRLLASSEKHDTTGTFQHPLSEKKHDTTGTFQYAPSEKKLSQSKVPMRQSCYLISQLPTSLWMHAPYKTSLLLLLWLWL